MACPTGCSGRSVRMFPVCRHGTVSWDSPTMARRPLVIAFDVIETLFPLEPLRQRIVEAGQPGHVLELWFSRLLRDAFALVASGGYRPFGEFAVAALRSTASTPVTDAQIQAVLAGFAE